jgi:DNA uptake protein ComE-like DNA-binding protein
VANGGAIALNAAERARDEECWTDWFHVPDLLESFGNPRNLTFIRHRLEDRCREPGEGGPLSEPDLIAADRRIRLGRSADAETVVETATGVDVSLKKGVPRNPKVVALDPLIRDYKGNGLALDTTAKHWPVSEWYAGEFASLHGECPWPCKTYDQIVFHTGLVTNEVGQPAKIVPENLDPLKGPKNRMIGMASADGRIRVLGAAAQMYPGLPQFDAANPGSTPSDLMWVFRQQLPVSAVPDGFILTGINIAVANDFFTPFNENKNINTMTQDEIASALRSAGIFFDADDLAKAIVEARNSSNGFSDLADLRKKLKAAAKRKPELIDAEKKRAEEEAWKNYNEEQKRTAELKSVYKDSVPTEITELEKLQRENQVNRLASISLSADRQKQEVDGKAKQLDDLLSTESGKINSAFKYSY